MARRTKGQSDPATDRLNNQATAHINRLGMTTIAEYKEWCAQRGLKRNVNKSDQQRRRELQLAMSEQADRLLRTSKQKRRSFGSAIDILIDRGSIDTSSDPRLDRLAKAIKFAHSNKQTMAALQSLLRVLRSDRDLLDYRRVLPSLGDQAGNCFINATLALAIHSNYWLRSPEEWKSRTHNARRRFNSLARHLFARYDVPAFMDQVWFLGRTTTARRRQRWFIHVAQGANIRTADLPIAYTKKMAHHFMMTPSDYSVDAAIRWGQIHGLGGDARLANAVRSTIIGERFSNDEFWITVLKFFIDNPMLDVAHVGPIIDFIHNRRFATRNVFVGRGVQRTLGPVQPNMSMRGRSVESLLAQVHRWHRQLSKESTCDLQWVRSEIKEFLYVEGRKGPNRKKWRILELLSSKELDQEGRVMRHCVGSYAYSCRNRSTSIWSMTVETQSGVEQVLTVEVNLSTKVICQARGKFNAVASDQQRTILRRWAAEQGLTLAPYL